MIIPLTDLALDIACPCCGALTPEFVRELRRTLAIRCMGCGKESRLDPAMLERQIAELDAKRFEVAAAFAKLKSLGF